MPEMLQVVARCDARIKAIALPQMYKARVPYYHYRKLCENRESPCTIMYHHVPPNNCF